jgi:hypothetical protein
VTSDAGAGHRDQLLVVGVRDVRLPARTCPSPAASQRNGSPRELNARQVLSGPTPFAGSGLFHVPCTYEGNQSLCAEEVDLVAAIVAGLTDRPGRGSP